MDEFDEVEIPEGTLEERLYVRDGHKVAATYRWWNGRIAATISGSRIKIERISGFDGAAEFSPAELALLVAAAAWGSRTSSRCWPEYANNRGSFFNQNPRGSFFVGTDRTRQESEQRLQHRDQFGPALERTVAPGVRIVGELFHAEEHKLGPRGGAVVGVVLGLVGTDLTLWVRRSDLEVERAEPDRRRSSRSLALEPGEEEFLAQLVKVTSGDGGGRRASR